MSIFVFHSDDFSSVFSKNASNKFITRLLYRTTFNSSSKITLLHLRIPPIKKAALVYVNCSCVCHAQVGVHSSHLLQIISVEASESEQSYSISTPLPRQLCSDTLEELKFTLRDGTGALATFGEGKTTILVQIE